jgi:hypothetical protein
MSDLYAALLSWAVTLSGYPPPEHAPEVVRKPHAFFVERACNGRECKVLGWYDGGSNVYIDDRLDAQNDLLASSIVVHEMVHYLQAVARNDAGPKTGAFTVLPSCRQLIHWEHEAYGVQREYIMRQGTYLPVGMSMLHAGCDHAETQPPAGPR